MTPRRHSTRFQRSLARFLVTTTLWFTWCLTAPPAAFAQPGTATSSFEGQTIVAIEFLGNDTLAEDTLQYYLDLEPGKSFSRAELDRSIKRLWERELVDDISVEALEASSSEYGSGVRLVVRIEERPRVVGVQYEGLKRISNEDLRDRLSAERVEIDSGSPLNLGELYRVKSVIEEAYAEMAARYFSRDPTLRGSAPHLHGFFVERARELGLPS